MSLESETLRPPGIGSEKLDEALKKPRRSFTREFLLSLSHLDVCKKLPSDFDESLLCELGEGVQSLQDRPRVSGSHHFQGFRRNDHGSSPPNRWDSAKFTAGSYGKTGSHSSVQSDRDSDSQSDRDSESGGQRWQSRRSWHATEHDGLLGSGTSSRLTGYVPGMSAPKGKTNDTYLLKKSNEPYQPPRPYKAVPYSKKETNCNDETFGSSDCISEDRAEEERMRRASFEQMRKEQQKALQEKQMPTVDHIVDDASDIFVHHDNKKRDIDSSAYKDQFAAMGDLWNNPSGKFPDVVSSPVYRPRVPPGFKNSITGRTPESKSNSIHALFEEGISTEEDTLESDTSFLYSNPGLERSTDQKSEARSQLPHASSRSLGDPGILKLSPHVLNEKLVVDSYSGASSLHLGTMLWGPVSTDRHGIPRRSENEGYKAGDARSAGSLESSRFSQGFFEADGRSADDLSSGRPDDILSLLVIGDKSKHQVSGSKTTEHSDDILLSNFEESRKLLSTSSRADSVVNEQASVHSKGKSFPTILTCEDLENSILMDYSAQNTVNLPPQNSRSAYQNVEPSNEHVDDDASIQLLSLLQRNSNKSKDEEICVANITISEPQVAQSTAAVAIASKENDKSIVNSENKLTLEMLFGSAFMKELQSVEAPVSIPRELAGSAEVQAPESRGITFPFSDTKVLSAVDPVKNFQRAESGQMLHSFNSQKPTELSSTENLLGIADSKRELSSFNPHAKDVPDDGRSTEFQVPENSIISSKVPPHGYQILGHMSASPNNHEHFSASAPPDHMNRLLTTPVVKDVGSMLGPEIMVPKYGSDENMDPYSNLPLQHSSSQLRYLQMTQGRPLPVSTESSIASRTSQVEVLGAETFYNHDSFAANRHFPTLNPGIVHPLCDPNTGIPRSDVASHHHPILHQIRTPGNYSSQMMTYLPRPGTGSHFGTQETGLHQESNSSFPFPAQHRILGHLLPTTPGTGINHRSTPPEALQRLVEVNPSAHFKQAHQFCPGHGQGIPWN